MPGQLKSFITTIKRRPSKAADGRSNTVAAASVGATTTEKTSLLYDVTHMGLKNAHNIAHALPALASGAPMNDKDLLLENGVSMLQGFPLNSSLSESISDGFISMLWSDLPHPAPTLAGPTSRYRRHDGGGNNPWLPEMGKAGTPYARNVPPMKPKGPNLPDVELVYDALLKREGPFRKHPSGLNRLFFSFATVVIHECFQTSRTDHFVNETSSYVDLSTLYGNTEKEQTRVRTKENGLIFPDSVASERIMMMPPGVIAVLMLFSRNHNQIAKNLLCINEDGKYKPWESLDEEQKKWQDEDIFQLSRNINVGFFATVVLKDYVAAILNTPRAGSEWSLNLGKEIKQVGKRVDRGNGNVVSVEFAVLYHWHAALSAADDKWMEDILRNVFPDLESLDDMTPDMYKKVMMVYGHQLFTTPAKEWTFGGLKRQEDGSFNDVDLADIIKDCIEEPAHEFGAHGTPASLKVVDIMGQLQARDTFNVCTLNEFRRYLNLTAYESFEDWNSDKETARAAELLYGHIENLELYPGLMAECTKPAMPGSGVCPGQTTGRGILDDAVALVRGDRFLSYDFNSNTLTHWGSALLGSCAPGAYGGMLPRLIFNGLPNGFTGTSPYALLPFYTPDAAKGIMKGNKVLDKYELERPASDMSIITIQTQEGCKQAYEDHSSFRMMSQAAVGKSPTKKDSMIGLGNLTNGEAESNILRKVFLEEGFEPKVSQFFSASVKKLVSENSLSFTKGRKSIDIVRDVINIAPILWLAERFAIPLKTQEQPRGLVSIWDTFHAFLAVFLYQNNLRSLDEWALRDAATGAVAALGPVFENHLKTQKGIKESVVDWLAKGSAFEVGPDADRIYHALNDTNRPMDDLIAECIGTGAQVAANLTHQAALLVDLFLSPAYEQHKERIVQLANADPASSERELQSYVYEGMRLSGVVPGLPLVASKDVTINDGACGPVYVPASRTVLIATSKVALDPEAFPEPEKLNPNRPVEDYALLGQGLNFSFGDKLAATSLAATLREVFKLKNVRRAKGKLGKFTVAEQEVAGVKLRRYMDSSSRESPFPTSLTLEYDG
ncbi:heme peroxidase [Aulographum hederae CBS 113979]|uniref:Heme peroxidase n=1 Tax=Aulographum hederae CBS 113979 TaxID=1176131 RepID=A0A6G1H5X9_9PEZI|nr:heme peroxidase [Aulographum hederae CBS 113979]